MKKVIWVAIIAAVAFGGYWFYTNKMADNSVEENSQEEVMVETEDEGGLSLDSGIEEDFSDEGEEY